MGSLMKNPIKNGKDKKIKMFSDSLACVPYW